MSLTASTATEESMLLFRYLDVVLVVVAAPILLLIGVPALGYGVGAGAWIALRAVGVAIERAVETSPVNREMTLRLAYLISRIFLLALTVVLVRRGAGKNDALSALLVIVFAFTVQLVISTATRPRKR